MTHIRSAFDTARSRQDVVILLGIEPESPETEYGWIEPAELIPGHRQVRVRRFWEKPGSSLAAVLQLRGHLWNSFVMVASAQAFLDVFAMATPALHRAFNSISSLFGTDESQGEKPTERLAP